jgi:hypothetical protein
LWYDSSWFLEESGERAPFWRRGSQGAGFLSIPHAFVVSGMVSGPVLCVFFAFLCNITKDYALEALSRLEALTKVRELERVCTEVLTFVEAVVFRGFS